ncbi:MAG: MerR family transcriptional regulator [Gemmatimonadaceae bacterium]
MNSTIRTDGLLPVRLVLRRTGLSADVLRAWERRYKAVQPERSVGGQRLYREEDVARLEKLRRLTILGHSIGRIAALSTGELDALLVTEQSHVASRPARERGDVMPDDLRATCMRAIERMDALLLDATLRRAAISLGPLAFAERVVGPLVVQVGELWHRGALRVGQEHLATNSIRSVLSWLSRASSPLSDHGLILFATTTGMRHELGAMMAASVASADGWNAVYLGSDLPVEEIADAIRVMGGEAIALSFVPPASGDDVVQRIVQLRSLVGTRVRIFAGGSAVEPIAARVERVGAFPVASLTQFRQLLRQAS